MLKVMYLVRPQCDQLVIRYNSIAQNAYLYYPYARCKQNSKCVTPISCFDSRWPYFFVRDLVLFVHVYAVILLLLPCKDLVNGIKLVLVFGMARGCTLLWCLLNLFAWANAYKPVVLYHGVLSGSESMVFMQHYIEYVHPGTKVYNCELYSNWFSLEMAWKQVSEFREYLIDITNSHPEGLIVIGFSQGGLIARTAIQSINTHNVKIFISLSSPQAGQFGSKDFEINNSIVNQGYYIRFLGSFLHIIFPDLAAKTAYELFYTSVGQLTSVGNYWNDPHQQNLYLKNCMFLPFVNNEIMWANATAYKLSLMRLEKMVLIGGPDDGVITPWQSSHFGFFNSSLDIVPFDHRDIYISDKIGIKALAEQGKLLIVVKPKVKHWSWHTDKNILEELIIPHLI